MARALLSIGLLLSLASYAAADPTLSGTAAIVPTADPGHPVALSESSTTTYPNPGYFGAATFTMPAGTTFGSITQLGSDFNQLAGSFAGGSPRFSLDTPSGNIFVYFGSNSVPSNLDSFAPNTWHNSGNLLGAGSRVDTTQVGGTFYDPIGNAQTAHGSLLVTSISLVTDAGWLMNQHFLFDNININGTIFPASALITPEPASLAVWGAVSVLGAAFGWRRRRTS